MSRRSARLVKNDWREELQKLQDMENESGESDEELTDEVENFATRATKCKLYFTVQQHGTTQRNKVLSGNDFEDLSSDSDSERESHASMEDTENEWNSETDEEWSDLSDDYSEGEIDPDFEVSVDRSVWKKHVFEESDFVSKGRIPLEGIMHVKPGPTSHAIRNVSTIVSAFGLFIDDFILNQICKCTEAEANRKLKINNWCLPKNELLAFIAVCYARGVLGMKNMSVNMMFSVEYGPALIRGIMKRDRFKAIMKYLRFDDKATRKERLLSDKFALVSSVWDRFIENCKTCYSPGENVTVDEQLFPSKTRCPFTQFMKDKPDKFGVKFFLVVDVDSKYMLNGFPFLGKVDNPDQENNTAGEQVVLRLMRPYFGGGYNVTTDNYFTSLNLAILLKEQNITLVGTANKKRRWLPDTAKLKNPKLSLHETITYLGPNGTTLSLYQCKKNKSVSVLSSLHKAVRITDSVKRKPETIHFYNQTKYGVDTFHQMAKKYTVKAASRRWPVHIFYNILDMTGINSYIIYKKVTGKRISRLNFLLQLAKDLRSLPSDNIFSSNKTEPSPGINTRKRHYKPAKNQPGQKKKLFKEPETPALSN